MTRSPTRNHISLSLRSLGDTSNIQRGQRVCAVPFFIFTLNYKLFLVTPKRKREVQMHLRHISTLAICVLLLAILTGCEDDDDRVSALQGEVYRLEQCRLALQGQVNELKSEVEDIKEQIAEIDAQTTGLPEKLTAILVQMYALETRIGILESEKENRILLAVGISGGAIGLGIIAIFVAFIIFQRNRNQILKTIRNKKFS